MTSTIVTIDDANQAGDKFKNWNVKPDGYLGEDDQDLAAQAMNYFAGFQTTAWSMPERSRLRLAGCRRLMTSRSAKAPFSAAATCSRSNLRSMMTGLFSCTFSSCYCVMASVPTALRSKAAAISARV